MLATFVEGHLMTISANLFCILIGSLLEHFKGCLGDYKPRTFLKLYLTIEIPT